MQLNRLNGCEDHMSTRIADLEITACGNCRRVEWADDSGEIDPAVGMAALFGNYELIGTYDAVGSPAPEVLIYQAPSVRKRRNLQPFPLNEWVKAAPDLWLTHDGENLLLATNHRLLFQNLTRGA